jgi:hypothetical protein
MMAADRPYGDFYDFYYVRPECFGYIPVDSYHISEETYCSHHHPFRKTWLPDSTVSQAFL